MSLGKLITVASSALLALIVAAMFGLPAYNRYQARANAHNATLTATRHVRIAQLEAQARYQTSIGLKRSQDEIRKTLTPLYVQFEMVQALEAIATSGKNNTVVYIPTDPTTGLPITPVANAVTPTK